MWCACVFSMRAGVALGKEFTGLLEKTGRHVMLWIGEAGWEERRKRRSGGGKKVPSGPPDYITQTGNMQRGEREKEYICVCARESDDGKTCAH